MSNFPKTDSDFDAWWDTNGKRIVKQYGEILAKELYADFFQAFSKGAEVGFKNGEPMG